jgi:hypothetical protein
LEENGMMVVLKYSTNNDEEEIADNEELHIKGKRCKMIQ